jgi:hypothetical protein
MDEPTGAAGGRGVIRLYRQRGFYRDHVRRYWVRIDGSPVSQIADGEARDFSVPAGDHRVRLTIDWIFSSREVTLTVREGEVAELTCRPGGPTLLILLSLLVPRRYIRLDGPIVPIADAKL